MHPVNPQIKQVFEKLKPIYGERINRLWRVYACDPYSRADIESAILAMADRHLDENFQSKRILLEPISAAEATGDYPIGNVLYDKSLHSFALRKSELSGHISVFGKSQSGKTNFGRLLIDHFLHDGTPFVCFDYKGNYSHFGSTEYSKSLLTVSTGLAENSFQFNPLIPPAGTDAAAYHRELIELLLSSYFPELRLLSVDGAEYLLMRALEKHDGTPTFRTLYKTVSELKATSEERRWKVSTLNLLYKLTHGPIGEVLNCSDRPMGQLLDKPVILNMERLGSSKDKSFLTQAILLWIFHQRVNEGKSAFKHCLIVEEAHHLFRARDGSPLMTKLIRLLAEYGEGICFMDQSPALTPPVCIGNTSMTICFNLKAKQDLEVMAPALQLKSDQISYLSSLQPGEAIVKLQNRHTKPFLVKLDYFSQGERMGHETTKADFPPSHMLNDNNPAIHTTSKPVTALGNPDKAVEKEMLGGGERLDRGFLLDIAQYPSSNLMDRYRRLGLNRRQGPKLKNSLLNQNLIISYKVSVLGRSVTSLELTESGRTAIGADSIQLERDGRGGFFHEFWKHWLASWLRAIGWTVLIEHPIGGGKTVDLVAVRNGHEWALEIETGKSDPAGNIEKCLQAGFKSVYSLCLSEETKLKVLEKFSCPANGSEVSVLTTQEFVSRIMEDPALHDP